MSVLIQLINIGLPAAKAAEVCQKYIVKVKAADALTIQDQKFLATQIVSDEGLYSEIEEQTKKMNAGLEDADSLDLDSTEDDDFDAESLE